MFIKAARITAARRRSSCPCCEAGPTPPRLEWDPSQLLHTDFVWAVPKGTQQRDNSVSNSCRRFQAALSSFLR
eukprot:7370853-Alexandrium_andersonii.AAC.1